MFLCSSQVLEFLCCPDDDSRHTERQQVHTQWNTTQCLDSDPACSCQPAVLSLLWLLLQVLLELLHVGSVVHFNEERLLALAEKAQL